MTRPLSVGAVAAEQEREWKCHRHLLRISLSPRHPASGARGRRGAGPSGRVAVAWPGRAVRGASWASLPGLPGHFHAPRAQTAPCSSSLLFRGSSSHVAGSTSPSSFWRKRGAGECFQDLARRKWLLFRHNARVTRWPAVRFWVGKNCFEKSEGIAQSFSHARYRRCEFWGHSENRASLQVTWFFSVEACRLFSRSRASGKSTMLSHGVGLYLLSTPDISWAGSVWEPEPGSAGGGGGGGRLKSCCC